MTPRLSSNETGGGDELPVDYVTIESEIINEDNLEDREQERAESPDTCEDSINEDDLEDREQERTESPDTCEDSINQDDLEDREQERTGGPDPHEDGLYEAESEKLDQNEDKIPLFETFKTKFKTSTMNILPFRLLSLAFSFGLVIHASCKARTKQDFHDRVAVDKFVSWFIFVNNLTATHDECVGESPTETVQSPTETFSFAKITLSIVLLLFLSMLFWFLFACERIRNLQGSKTSETVEATAKSTELLVDLGLTRLGSLQKIIILDLWANDVDTVVKSLTHFLELCAPDGTEEGKLEAEKNRALAFELGGHASLIASMHKWQSFPEVQAAGCGALHFAWLNNCFQDAACQLGAPEVCVKAMKNFPYSERVQSNGCCFLYSYSSMGNESASDLINRLDGLGVISRAMNGFQEHVMLQRWCCCLLASLSQWREFREQINGQNFRRHLAAAQELFPDDAIIQEKASVAIDRLNTWRQT